MISWYAVPKVRKKNLPLLQACTSHTPYARVGMSERVRVAGSFGLVFLTGSLYCNVHPSWASHVSKQTAMLLSRHALSLSQTHRCSLLSALKKQTYDQQASCPACPARRMREAVLVDGGLPPARCRRSLQVGRARVGHCDFAYVCVQLRRTTISRCH